MPKKHLPTPPQLRSATPPPETESDFWLNKNGVYLKTKGPTRWPLEDEIRFVENSEHHRQTFNKWKKDGLISAEAKRFFPSTKDRDIWLDRERDGLSWNDLANKYFPHSTPFKAREQPDAISAARRAHERVERYLIASENERRR